MRIGILTPHYAFNYGAVLQAFALKTFLRTLGHDAVIINRRPQYQCAIPSLCGRAARSVEVWSKRNSFGAFEKKYLQPQTSPVIFQSDWEQFPSFNLDAVIVGSDQVWRDDYTFNSFGFNLFLDFTEGYDVKRIAYAPSLGKGTWNATPEREGMVRKLLHNFDAISVREESSVGILKSKFSVDSEVVVDPTLLLKQTDYMTLFNLMKNEKFHSPKYIGSYILDNNSYIKQFLRKTSHHLDLPVKGINIDTPSCLSILGKLHTFVRRFTTMPSVIDWVKNIADAEFVVTNSFHGMVFSIIFEKQFVAIMNKERGAARFKSLLRMFDLEDRLVSPDNKSDLSILDTPINYNKVNSLVDAWRVKSIAYINNALFP